jgi:transaldolase / glucose-6-phosphate isomerase
VHLRLGARQDRAASALASAGHPVVTFGLNDAYDLGAEFVRWEIATAVAARMLDVHPFAEPQSIELDAAARRALGGVHDPATPSLIPSSPDFAARLGTRLAAARGRRWVALAAYVGRTPRRERLLADIRAAIRKRFGVATTLAFGSGTLHATGQLHAAGPPTLIALEITADDPADVPLPGKPYGLTAAQRAEASGRAQVLLAHQRPMVHVHLGRHVEAGLSAMLLALQRRPAPPRSRPAAPRKPVATRTRAGRRR